MGALGEGPGCGLRVETASGNRGGLEMKSGNLRIHQNKKLCVQNGSMSCCWAVPALDLAGQAEFSMDFGRYPLPARVPVQTLKKSYSNDHCGNMANMDLGSYETEEPGIVSTVITL